VILFVVTMNRAENCKGIWHCALVASRDRVIHRSGRRHDWRSDPEPLEPQIVFAMANADLN